MAQKQDDEFIPLNKRCISHSVQGNQNVVAALNIIWADNRCFTKYTSFKSNLEPDSSNENHSAMQIWCNETEWFIRDLKHLLQLEHHRYWSTIVYNGSAMESIDSFMQNALPSYLISTINGSDKKVVALYKVAHTYVFKVICRLTMQKESPVHWIETDYFFDMLYERFIITIPFVFDLLSIYGRDNKEVSFIIESAIKFQPKYVKDLKHGLTFLLNALTTVQEQLECGLNASDLSKKVLNELVFYSRDCSFILCLLVEISPSISIMCCEQNMEYAISNFYDNVLVALYEYVQHLNGDSNYLALLNDARIDILQAFRSIMCLRLKEILQNPVNSILSADKIICILTECLSNSMFVNDYKNQYQIDVDLEIVKQAYDSIDEFKFDYIRQAYTISDGPTKQASFGFANEDDLSLNFDTNDTKDEERGNAEQIEKNVDYVLDILPHLSPDYVREVVSRCNNLEQIVIDLLESNPANNADHISVPLDPLDEFFAQTGIDRLNIYDGDEFDVMVNSSVAGVIKKGKGMPGEPKTLNELLDDKSHVNQMRHLYQRFDHISENEDNEEMAERESRHVTVVREIKNIVDNDMDNESEVDDQYSDTEIDTKKPAPLSFCLNPEVARKRYEEKLNSKMVRRHGTSQAPQGANEVRGNPEKQGQNSTVLQNRKTKNKNKASRANHNRKQGANYKRSRGMMPS
ncbi:activating signal cointegrator 1 complex subunit 2 [Anopheles cruzii]|uniref:activating signal cointegrator 1 complex subunit 2 n=1 Tax=Anopheles cruzii TaxID=68878 RepID=UPI0022EC6C16|nr:activating signal cointegrator 1 complex subunit 2 [Anopheles cruzii]XP_052860317.1 activating signal cointegrator 1 complex subunit 2 [Anopheles cruzii]